MLTLLTTSFTIQCEEPDYINCGKVFQNLIAAFFDMDIEKHPDYNDAWVFSITYPSYQAKEYAQRIQELIEIIIDNPELVTKSELKLKR